jgi:signal transduction histidine kinase
MKRTGSDAGGNSGTNQVGSAIAAFHEVVQTVSSMPRLNDVVDKMVNHIIDKKKGLGFDFAAIQLVDVERNEIRTVHTKGFEREPSEFDLWQQWGHRIEDSPDIQADILRTKKWERIYDWDPRFDREIWDAWEHWRLARIFGPILVGPDRTAIGTVEAGYYKKHKSKIDDEEASRLKVYVEEAGDDIAKSNLAYLLQEIAEIGVRRLGIDLVTIYRYDQDKNQFGLPETRAGEMRKPGHVHHEVREDDVVARIVRARKSFYFRNAEKARFLGGRENRFVEREGIVSSAGLLLQAGANTIGVLFANYRRPMKFTKIERDILETFARHAAISMENAYLYRRACVDLERRITQVNALREIGKTITSTVDEKEVLSLILQRGLRLTDARRGCGFILLRGGDDDSLQLAASYAVTAADIKQGLKRGKTIVHLVEHTRKPARVPESKGAVGYRAVSQGARSAMAVPLLRGEELVGVLGIESPGEEHFDDEHLALLDTFAGQVVIAIENAKAYRALEEGKQHQLLITLGGVAAGMVERMRNTVSTIPWHVDTIRENVSPPRGQARILREYLDLIEQAAEEASSEVEEVHNLIQARSVRRDRVAVGTLLKRAVKGARQRSPGMPSQLPLNLELGERALYIRGDAVLLRKAFERLIINAIQAIDGKGKIQIRCRADRSGRNALVYVSDTGRGIPPELLPDRLFELGVTTRPGGLGIGLWFCKRTIDEHEGAMQIRSRIGKGSTFTIRLPLYVPRRVTGKGGRKGHGH